MNIELKNLSLKNFKGIKDLTIDFKEKTKIYGKNEIGKTTIFNAYMWLLWGKDSKNRKDYEIKPYKQNGENIHNVETSVEGVLLVDGKELKIKRVYKEKRTKKRGSTAEEFTGHTTDYYINEVPKKQKDYNDYISKLLSEEEFKLLSNPLYFNEMLNNNERRDILIGLVDEVKPDDVLEQNKDLKELDLANYTIEELQAIAKGSLKRINENLTEIPARIDELIKMKANDDFVKLEVEKERLEKSIEKVDKALADTSNVSDLIKEKSKKISNLESKKRKVIADWQAENQSRKNLVEDKKRAIKRKIDAAIFEIENKESQREDILNKDKDINKRLEAYISNLDDLRLKWVEKNGETYKGDFTCPTCGQTLPSDQVAEIKANFNLNKSKTLEDIQQKANGQKEKIKELEEKLEINKKQLTDLKSEKEKIIEKKESLQKELLNIKEFTEAERPKQIEEIEKKIESVEKELKELANNDNLLLIANKKDLNYSLTEVNKKLANKGLNEEIDKKINNYESQEKTLAKEYEEQQKILYLCEEYTKAYVDLVSEKINNLFEFAEFKLFETQINGGIKETAEATYGGVPYGALNNAATINIGLDIINTLSKKLDKSIPIFIDNAESINKILDVESQTVELIVSDDKELKIK